MKFISKLKSFIFSHCPKSGIPSGLQKIIDEYESAAVVTSYNSQDPIILYANKKHKKLTEYSSEELVGASPKLFQGNNTSDKVRKELRDELKKGSFWHGTIINYRKSGTQVAINLTIFGICYEGRKYYIALKRLSGE